jgi:NADPH-dependent curcumin reductase CurA
LNEIGKPKEGETILISGACGTVGSIVGQLAKLKGCTVVGITGSDEKVDYITKELGFDKAINYKKVSNMKDEIQRICPNGIDLYYDNVGGDILDAAILNLKQFGRIVICGSISGYNKEDDYGPRLWFHLVSHSARIEAFNSQTYKERWPEAHKQLIEYLDQGKIKYRETVVEGFENILKGFQSVLSGGNIGKEIICVSPFDPNLRPTQA